MHPDYKKNKVRMLVKGGIISPSYLIKILHIAQKYGSQGISIGSRQDIIFNLPKKNSKEVEKDLSELKFDYVLGRQNEIRQQNIVSSYVSYEIMPGTHWLSAGDYIRILEQISSAHSLRINIADPKQSIIPLFYGHLNFVASSHNQYWYLYLRLPSSYELQRWPVLIFSDDIAPLCKSIEELHSNNGYSNLDDLFSQVMKDGKFNHKHIDEPLKITQQQTFEYEGFRHMHGSDKLWAGYYWRNNRYDIHFMKEMCELCIKTGISKLYLTSWKSFIVKDIEEKYLVHWQAMNGKLGITMRHSAFELNWHLPLGDRNAYKLKKYIINKFDKRDVSVSNFTFAITNDKDIPFCSIIVQQKPLPSVLNKLNFLKSYIIKVADLYDPNSCKYHVFSNDCPRHKLPDILARAISLYYDQFIPGIESKEKKVIREIPKIQVYQCPNCLTVYSPEYGDPQLNIQPGTLFNDLPDRYHCPLCETKKEQFIRVDLSQLQEV